MIAEVDLDGKKVDEVVADWMAPERGPLEEVDRVVGPKVRTRSAYGPQLAGAADRRAPRA